jgi:hypothetical protein
MTLLFPITRNTILSASVVLFTGLALSMLAKVDFSAVAFAQG